MTEWLPIEDVPQHVKDTEERILAYREGYAEDCAVVWWHESHGEWQAVHGGAVFYDVTHWQPRPPAPACKSESELKQMLRDPRYWRDQDPEFVERVRAGFRELDWDRDGFQKFYGESDNA
jgi:hypothetical protein